jgi:hypothetical protein
MEGNTGGLSPFENGIDDIRGKESAPKNAAHIPFV